MKKHFLYSIFLLSISFNCFAKAIKIGIMAGPSVEILNVAKKIAKEKYNLDIEPIVFTNYIMPNEALNDKDIDMNIYQTNSFLNASISNQNYNIISIGNTFIYPMGIFSKKIQTLKQVSNNSTIAIPNDASNEERALLLLENVGIIHLKRKQNNFYNVQDIDYSKTKIKIITLDAATLARVVPDVDAVVLNNDFVHQAGFNDKEALAQENAKNSIPYINIIAVNKKDTNNEELKIVVQIMHSQQIIEKTKSLYPSAIPAWN